MSKNKTKKSDEKTLESKYQLMTPVEHVLKRSDMYLGSLEKTDISAWVFDEQTEKMVFKDIQISAACYKCFDEILVNSIDQYVRLKQAGSSNPVTRIDVSIDPSINEISIANNGEGIPVAIHEEHKIFLPELLFGHLLSSGNYDDSDGDRIVGGKNGLGGKICNIYSKKFMISTTDSERCLKFEQTYTDNMSQRGEPKITKSKTASYTRFTFQLDLARFGMTTLDDDIVSLLKRRVYDIAGLAPDVAVYLNGTRLKINSFQKYVDMYLPEGTKKAHYVCNDRWEMYVALSPDEKFEQVSFVNNISTLRGGKHVAHVTEKIVGAVLKSLLSKKGGEKKYGSLKASHIKDQIWLFLKATISNPAFDSQTKETLTTPSSKFGGSKFEVSGDEGEKFVESVIKKTGIVERAMRFSMYKESSSLSKTDGGGSVRSLRGVPKLEDANWAGGPRSSDCTLILTEGDSAKAFAVSGLSVLGREKYGIFPLKGKLLNVREETNAKVAANDEIGYLKQIIGLQHGAVYTSTVGLRYGHILILTDQDVDGHHIKGLVMNFFHSFWPSLCEIPGFLCSLATPIVRCTRTGQTEICFYNETDYETWRETVGEAEASRWYCKYFKGLGTNTAQMAKEIFAELDNQIQRYFSDSVGNTETALILAFAKKVATGKGSDLRKEWLTVYDRAATIDFSKREVTYHDFIHLALKHFSIDANLRAIPSLVDGLKPSQRKILYGAFKRRLTKELKVAQLAGYIAEHTGYHHGEKSLEGAIVGMAADFVGSNNINLLMPNGQFGTRCMGGKDHASSRYIFTELNRLTSLIFHPDDGVLLNYLSDDGLPVEPEYYVPVIPMILVNGANGIGTGYSSDIPCYNPLDIIANLRRMLAGSPPVEMTPWFRGFFGKVVQHDSKFFTYGRYERLDDERIRITELPIQTWTKKYKEFLDGLIVEAPSKKRRDSVDSVETSSSTAAKTRKSKKLEPCLKDVMEYTDDKIIDFVITFVNKETLDGLMADPEQFEFALGLRGSDMVSTTNMHLFDANYCIKKFDTTAINILNAFYPLRMDYYHQRHQMLVAKVQREYDIAAAKVRFIEEHQSKVIEIYDRELSDIVVQLETRQYPRFSKRFIWPPLAVSVSTEASASVSIEAAEAEATEAEVTEAEAEEDEKKDVASYNYLLNMQFRSLTKKRLEELRVIRDEKQAELTALKKKTAVQIWNEDLDVLETEYRKSYDAWMQVNYPVDIATLAPGSAVKSSVSSGEPGGKTTKKKTTKKKVVIRKLKEKTI